MKNHRFLWLRNRTTDNRKCEKARNIKEKRTIGMFNTDLKQLVEHHSSQRDNIKKIYISKSPEKSGLSLCQKLKNKHFLNSSHIVDTQ